MTKPKVLIIDDEYSIRNMMDIILSGQFSMLFTTSCKEGFRNAVEEHPDCIVMDVLFSGKENGLETCRKIKKDKQTKNIPVIVYSCKRNKDDHIKALNMGVEGYLEKSRDKDILSAYIRKAINKKSR